MCRKSITCCKYCNKHDPDCHSTCETYLKEKEEYSKYQTECFKKRRAYYAVASYANYVYRNEGRISTTVLCSQKR